jgi:hypothetical protein
MNIFDQVQNTSFKIKPNHMKKISLILLIAISTALVFSSCASVKGKGCPTTNPRYFRG